MTVTNEQRKALKAVAAEAAEVAELIRQRDQAPIDRPFSDPPRVDLRSHGPDIPLQAIEAQLRAIAKDIGFYLGGPPEG
jgi:hypothetical protein